MPRAQCFYFVHGRQENSASSHAVPVGSGVPPVRLQSEIPGTPALEKIKLVFIKSKGYTVSAEWLRPRPLIIDEVQLVLELFRVLADALVGRMAVETLLPFSAAEHNSETEGFIRKLFKGDFGSQPPLPLHVTWGLTR